MLTTNMLPSGWDATTVAATILFSVAITATLIRLGYRYIRQQLYWDDFWALIALLTSILAMGVMVVESIKPLGSVSMRSRSFLLWTTILTHPIEIWTSRLSIAVTIVRVFPPGKKQSIAKAACLVMASMGIVVIVQKVWISGAPGPYIPPLPFTKLTPILSLTCNMICDIFLITWPALMLLKMKLAPTHTWLLIACFSTSFFVMVVDLVHSIYFIKGDIIAAGIAAYILMGLSLLLCNTTVLATFLYRQFVVETSFRGLPIHLSRSAATTNPRFETTCDKSAFADSSGIVDSRMLSRITEVDIYPEGDRLSERTRSSSYMGQGLPSPLPDKEPGLPDIYPPQGTATAMR